MQFERAAIMSEPSSKPLATYTEARFDGTRQFELFADRIRVTGAATLQSRVDTTIPLSRIHPQVIKLWVRNRVFWVGTWIATIGLISATLLVKGFNVDPFSYAPGALGVIGMSGIALCLATARMVEFARFESDAGVAVLDIARQGPDVERFDQFIEQVLNKTITARRPA